MKNNATKWDEYYSSALKFAELFRDYILLKDMNTRSVDQNNQLKACQRIIDGVLT